MSFCQHIFANQYKVLQVTFYTNNEIKIGGIFSMGYLVWLFDMSDIGIHSAHHHRPRVKYVQLSITFDPLGSISSSYNEYLAYDHTLWDVLQCI